MARSRRRNNRLRSRPERNIVNSPLLADRLLRPNLIKVRSPHQLLLDNARLYGHDDRPYNPISKPLRPARTRAGRIASTTVKKNVPLSRAQFHFSAPRDVVVCVRRGVRKEVLHALKQTGKRGSRHKKYRRTRHSEIRC